MRPNMMDTAAFALGAVLGCIIGAAAVLMHYGAWKLFAGMQ